MSEWREVSGGRGGWTYFRIHDRGLDASYMEATGNQNVDLNSQLGTIVATHPHLQLKRTCLPSPSPSLNFVVHPCPSSRGSASHVFLVEFGFLHVKRFLSGWWILQTSINSSANVIYFFLSARAGGILRILQSDWLRGRAEFSYLWPISDHGHGNRAKTIEWKLKNNIPRLNSGIFFIYGSKMRNVCQLTIPTCVVNGKSNKEGN